MARRGGVQRDVRERPLWTARVRSTSRVAAAAAVAAGVVVLVVLARGDRFATTGSTSTSTVASTSASGAIPSFVGLTLDQARARARHHGGRVEVELWAPSSRARDDVLSQAPTSWPVGLVVSTGPWTTPHAALPGEKSGPIASECAVVVHLEADGNVTPLLCGARHVDVGAWIFYSKGRPLLLTLARDATRPEIEAALCASPPKGGPTSNLTLPERLSVYTLARAYNGWTTPSPREIGEVLAAHPDGAACRRALAS